MRMWSSEKGVQGCLTNNDPNWWQSILTATVNGGTNALALFGSSISLAEIGYDPGSVSSPGGPTNGMPLHGSRLTSQFDPTIHYQMPATYKGPNAWMIDANNNASLPSTITSTIVFSTPTNVVSLAILHAMAAGLSRFGPSYIMWMGSAKPTSSRREYFRVLGRWLRL